MRVCVRACVGLCVYTHARRGVDRRGRVRPEACACASRSVCVKRADVGVCVRARVRVRAYVCVEAGVEAGARARARAWLQPQKCVRERGRCRMHGRVRVRRSVRAFRTQACTRPRASAISETCSASDWRWR
eukprot:3421020-Pleurochrysis_carterae.AAC.3